VLLEKPDPVAVSVKAGPPALALVGAMLVSVRKAGRTVKVREAGTGEVVMVIAAGPGEVRSEAGTVAVNC
jgi:hypothetical protein